MHKYKATSDLIQSSKEVPHSDSFITTIQDSESFYLSKNNVQKHFETACRNLSKLRLGSVMGSCEHNNETSYSM